MKKLLSILLVISLCFSMFAISVAAADEDIVVSVKGGNASQGGTITVPINLDVNKGFTTLGIQVSYDSNVLEIECPNHKANQNCSPSVVKNNLSSGNNGLNSQYHTVNPYLLQWAYPTVDGSITKNVTKTGQLAKITFKVKNNAKVGETKVNIVVDQASDYASNRLVAKGGEATINITACSAHKYDNNCDATCNICSAKRTVTHTRKLYTTAATLTKDGKVVKKCTVCGSISSQRVIKKVKSITLSTSSYLYNGKVRTPGVTVKDSEGKTVNAKFYTVTYANGRKNVGEYKVTVKFKGEYSGSKTVTFTIVPPKSKVTSTASAKKSFTVKLSKQSNQVTGYQIQYATNKNFTGAARKTVSGYSSVKHTFKNLKAKTTYYVRVRTYKTVNGKHYYSPYSAAVAVKTK